MSIKRTEKEFMKQVADIYDGEYDYPDLSDIRNISKIPVICKLHGRFEVKVGNHINLKHGCPICARNDKLKEIIRTATVRANEIHYNKYDYSLVEQSYINSYTEVDIICPKHGVYQQTMHSHLKGRGCKYCNKGEHTLEEWIMLVNEIHDNKYNYTNVVNTSSRIEKVIITCPTHGDFKQMAYSHLAGKGCPKCSHIISTGETQLKIYLESITNTDILTNNRTIIPPKELDIYIPAKKIAIEYNGIYWHGENKGRTRKYHLSKTLDCNSKGIRLIHITDFEWINKQEIVKSRLKNILGLTKYKLYGRKCTIKEIDAKTKTKFMNKYHIQGSGASSIKLGAFYKNRLVAVMTFGNRRFDKKEGYELVRYATIASFSCVGVAGKLLKHFELTYNPKMIISYADLRWSEGGVYNALGFTHKHNSNPNYLYFKPNTTNELMSRIQFQKHKLKDKLETFDPNITEWENMKANGYDRIWDCGNMVFEKVVK